MTTYNTGNPLGSAAAKDLYDNAQNLDFAVNEITKAIWTDRFGKLRKTWYGIESAAMDAIRAFGYITMDSFEDGATLTLPNQVLRWKNNGEYYRWDGSLSVEKVVPSGSTPESTGGVGLGAWISVGDAALRSQLSDLDSPSKYPELHIARWRDEGDVRGWGAVGDGITDDTSSFLLAEDACLQVYVPDGSFLVNTLLINLNKYVGPGLIYGLNGQIIAASSPLINGQVVQKKMMNVDVGFDNGTTDTQIFPGSQYAPQGVAYVYENSVTRLFTTQRDSVSGGDEWSDSEKVRICETTLRNDGGDYTPEIYSSALTASHANLSAILEGGSTWLYTSAYTESGADASTGGAGKGWSKINWKGAGTADTDVTQYRVFGSPGSGHKYQYYGKGRICVSSCGKYVHILAGNYVGSAGGYTLFTYDRLAVEAMENPLLAEPLYSPIVLDSLPSPSASGQQGQASDGRYIYILWGGTQAFERYGITIHKIDGTKVRDLYLDGPRGQYTSEELLNNATLGFPASFEPEGLSLKGHDVLGIFVDFFRNSNSVVTYEGYNFAPTLAGLTGISPMDAHRWVKTTKASGGTYDSTATYTVTNTTKRAKPVYAFRSPTGENGEQPVNNSVKYDPPVTPLMANADYIFDTLAQRGTAWRAGVFDPQTGKYYSTFDYSYNYSLRIFDSREGADNSKWASFRLTADSTANVASLRSAQGSTGLGAYADFYTNASASNQGEARISSGMANALARLMVNGVTKFAANDAYNTFYQNARFITDATYNFGSAAYRTSSIYLVNSPVVTSDATTKTDPRDMSAAEISAFGTILKLPGVWQWLAKYASEGDDARLHSGPTVQAAIAVMTANNLDWTKYAAFCYDSWDAMDAEEDDEGNVISEAREAGGLYSFRRDELIWWCMRAQASQTEDLETKLEALISRVKALESGS